MLILGGLRFIVADLVGQKQVSKLFPTCGARPEPQPGEGGVNEEIQLEKGRNHQSGVGILLSGEFAGPFFLSQALRPSKWQG